MLYQILRDIHNAIPISLGQQVGDVNIHLEGTPQDALERSARATNRFLDYLGEVGLQASLGKCALISSSKKLGRA
eukprot:8526341-Prorocentrum_lima.AAC.1